MQASKAQRSGGLNDGDGDLGEDLANDVHPGDAANLGFGFHVDAVRDDLQRNPLDVVGNHVVSSGNGRSGTTGLEQSLTGTW